MGPYPCLSTSISLSLDWSNYDQLILSIFGWIVGLYVMSIFLKASINAKIVSTPANLYNTLKYIKAVK